MSISHIRIWLWYRWTRREHQEYSNIEVGQNSEKSPGGLAVTQPPMKDHQLTLV